jgi:CRP/FNR family transcriptional activator FtrB
MRTDILTLLRDVPLFSDTSAATIEKLSHGAFAQWFPAEVLLHDTHQSPDFMFVLLDGAVEQTLGPSDSVSSTLRFLRPPSPFGIPGCVIAEVPGYATRTIERSRILMLPAATVRDALAEDIGLTMALLRHVTEAWVATGQDLHRQKVHNSAERLAHWILTQVDTNGVLELPFQKRRLAALVGTTPENLSRNIALLRDHGVDFEGRVVKVRDRAALRALASVQSGAAGVA